MEAAAVVVVMLAMTATPEAAEQASRAWWAQSGYEQPLNAYIDKRTSPELRAAVGNVALVAKTVADRRIVFTWRFP